MRFSKLTPYGKTLIENALNQESEIWEQSAHWWKGKDKKGKAEEEMKNWFAQFETFKKEIQDDKEIDQAIVDWINLRYGTKVVSFAALPPGLINAPQIQFIEAYNAAIKDTPQE